MSGPPIYKILLLGDPDAGKSCLLLRYVDETYSDVFISTIGVDYKSKNIQVDGSDVKLQIWDPSKDSQFNHVTSSFYRGAAGIFLMFDVGNAESFQNISEWLSAVKRFGSCNVTTFIVGAKCDKEERVVSIEQAKELADSEGLTYIETSAKEDLNVEEAFNKIASSIAEIKAKEEILNPKGAVACGKPKKKRTCSIQ
uniref:Uncharacterized protein n=1 Tax=Vannella robusta TaxID=1487602 RepID=A0A7S4IMH1_9EUKA